MKTIEVEITGTSPLLMHNIGRMAMEGMTRGKGKSTVKITSPEEEAEDAAYRDEKGKLIVPARCVKASLVNASTWYKMNNKSMKPFISGCLIIEPLAIPLNQKDYEIDRRTVVIQSGRRANRIIRSRPIFNEWKLNFNIVYNEQIFPDGEPIEMVKRIIEEAGVRCGILDFRPQHGGENGMFKLTKFKQLKGTR